MSNRSQERLDEHGFNDLAERSSYRIGYADGYKVRSPWANNPVRLWPKAYFLGYKEGLKDYYHPQNVEGN